MTLFMNIIVRKISLPKGNDIFIIKGIKSFLKKYILVLHKFGEFNTYLIDKKFFFKKRKKVLTNRIAVDIIANVGWLSGMKITQNA